MKTNPSVATQGDSPEAQKGAPRRFPVADERRATIQAMNAWSAARGDGDLPDVGAVFDGSCRIGDGEFFIMVDGDNHGSVFIVFGADIPLCPGEHGIGSSVARAVAPSQRDMFCEACAEAVRDGVAVHREGKNNVPLHETVRYRCNFPPMRSGLDVGNMYIFGAFGSKNCRASERDFA